MTLQSNFIPLDRDDAYIAHGDNSMEYASELIKYKRTLGKVTELMTEYFLSGEPDLVIHMNLWLNTIGYGLPDETEEIVDGERKDR